MSFDTGWVLLITIPLPGNMGPTFPDVVQYFLGRVIGLSKALAGFLDQASVGGVGLNR